MITVIKKYYYYFTILATFFNHLLLYKIYLKDFYIFLKK